MAAAPEATAPAMNSRPSTLLPGRAANRNPSRTLRLSAVTPVITGSTSHGRFRICERVLLKVPPPERLAAVGSPR
jgi:hypothetical protein